MKFIYLTFMLLVMVSSPLPAAAQHNTIPLEAAKALHAPEKVILYSLEPWSDLTTNDITLHGVKVLGQVTLEGKQAAMASDAFESAILQGANMALPDCLFSPRHALRVTVKDQTYDFLLCYQCGEFRIYRGKICIATVPAGGSPEVLNSLLTANKIPLSKTGGQ